MPNNKLNLWSLVSNTDTDHYFSLVSTLFCDKNKILMSKFPEMSFFNEIINNHSQLGDFLLSAGDRIAHVYSSHCQVVLPLWLAWSCLAAFCLFFIYSHPPLASSKLLCSGLDVAKYHLGKVKLEPLGQWSSLPPVSDLWGGPQRIAGLLVWSFASVVLHCSFACWL